MEGAHLPVCKRRTLRHPSRIPPWRMGARLRCCQRNRQLIPRYNKGRPRWSSSTAVTMSFTHLDPTQCPISSSLHSPIVAVGCSHRIQWRKPKRENCRGNQLCRLELRRNVVDLDELRLGQTVEPRGVPGTVHRGGWAIRDRNAWAKHQRHLPDTPLTLRAGMHNQCQLAPHIVGH